MPFTKYFCTKGKTKAIGITVNTVITMRAVLAGSSISAIAEVASGKEKGNIGHHAVQDFLNREKRTVRN